jgi:hypothetical protein
MHSIYHFFKNLVERKDSFLVTPKLENFPFDDSLLSCKSAGKFPDMAIRLNPGGGTLMGGELIELKDSKSYAFPSFNSTIPTGRKKIADVITGENSSIAQQMEQAGDDIASLPVRDVFYLVRGIRKGHTKVCLVHGSFFETVAIEDLIAGAFDQVLKERLDHTGGSLSDEAREKLTLLFSSQKSFSKVRSVERASVKLRFRVMTEVKAEGNILNSEKYPEIKDGTLNLILPCDGGDSGGDEKAINEKLRLAFTEDELSHFEPIKIKHHFNGYFLALQTKLIS